MIVVSAFSAFSLRFWHGCPLLAPGGTALAFTRPPPLLLRNRLDGLRANPLVGRVDPDKGCHRDDLSRAARPRQTSLAHSYALVCHAYPGLSPRHGLLAGHSHHNSRECSSRHQHHAALPRP